MISDEDLRKLNEVAHLIDSGMPVDDGEALSGECRRNTHKRLVGDLVGQQFKLCSIPGQRCTPDLINSGGNCL